MQVLAKIRVDMARKGPRPVVDAVQYDAQSRVLDVELLQEGEPWTPPQGTIGIVSVHKADGTDCVYETDEAGMRAVEISEGRALVLLAAQALAAAGDALVGVTFYAAGGARLGMFNLRLRVQRAVVDDDAITSSDYFNILTDEIDRVLRTAAGAGGAVWIRGTYATLEELEEAVPEPVQGHMYNVGAEPPYNIYMWDETEDGEGQWLDQGHIEGPQGATGDRGATGVGLGIKGLYTSQSALEEAVPSPAAGDAYMVGSTAPYDLYIYSGSAWTNCGEMPGLPVDATLTAEGQAADAKVVGDKFADAQENFEYFRNGVVSPKVSTLNGDITRSYVRDNGTIGSSTSTCTSKFNALGDGYAKYSVPEGFKIYAIAEYSSNSDTSFVQFIVNGGSEREIEFKTSSDKFYCLSVRKQDGSAFTVGEFPSSSRIFTAEVFTDDTLTKSGKAADAHAVGELFETVQLNISPILEQGTLRTNNGTEQASDTRIRTRKMSYVYGSRITISAGFKWSYRLYGAGGSFIAASDWMTRTNATLNLAPSVAFVRFILAHNDDTAITPSVETGFAYVQPEENTSIDLTKRASFCGNVSIRAGKTVNFSDGTPPINDWYLLQNTANEFYASKDLKSKKYLFTFNPPSGKVADWSVGITSNNDILFVADAAGLDGTNRLDDSNRVNPVCYLASENYKTMHVIDFGAEKKPCGWLGNVGFCLLPNGDIVMCEYTRGTVQTTNVWLISGDVSDPNNWNITWTANIIDVIDSTTPGIKHCHQVQYDFYTGIVYFGTGDSPTGSYTYYSLDNGATWTLLYGPDKNRCRVLTYVFTKDKVYWASDSHESEYRHFFVTDRDENGLIDVANATQIDLDSTNGQSCYGSVYDSLHNCIVLMDRCDGTRSAFYWYCFDISSQTVKMIGEFHTQDGSNTYLGFRTKFVDWYPRNSEILVGFNPSCATSVEDTNRNPLCGNGSGTTGDGSTRINNLSLNICKNSGDYSFIASTAWI